jgi:hypothetical protein
MCLMQKLFLIFYVSQVLLGLNDDIIAVGAESSDEICDSRCGNVPEHL